MDRLPNHVRFPNPVSITMDLKPFSARGELFPTPDASAAFNLAAWSQWREIPDRHDTQPHVMVLDFSGITALKPETVGEGFAFVLGNFRGSPKPVFVVFDNISTEGPDQTNPWQSFGSGLNQAARRPIVVIGRRQGDPSYDLTGSPSKVRQFLGASGKLAVIDDWVSGHVFARDHLQRPNVALLNMIHEEGLVLKFSRSHRSYYRSVVSDRY